MLRPGSPHDQETTRARLLRRYARWQRAQDLEALVLSYRPLARSLARRYAAASCPHEDLEQAAFEGLIKAIQRFEPDRGVPFTSFAVPTILGELRRYLRDTSWPAHVPRALQDRVRAVRGATESFSAVHGRTPTVAELVAVTGADEGAVVEALGAVSSLNVVPLDRPAWSDETETATVVDLVGCDDPGYERVEDLATIEDALPRLTRAEKRVVRLHFGEDLTQRQIALRLGISRSEVARELAGALARLRTATQQAA